MRLNQASSVETQASSAPSSAPIPHSASPCTSLPHVTSSSHAHGREPHAAASRAREQVQRVYATSQFKTDGDRVYSIASPSHFDQPQYQDLRHSSVMPSPLIDTWEHTKGQVVPMEGTKGQVGTTSGEDKVHRTRLAVEQPHLQQQQRPAKSRIPPPQMSPHEANSIVHRMSSDLMISYAQTSSSLAALLQAERAELDIRSAQQALDREETMRTSSSKWDAGATERERALSLHASEPGRHMLDGRNRVAAAEASVEFDKAASTYQHEYAWPLMRSGQRSK